MSPVRGIDRWAPAKAAGGLSAAGRPGAALLPRR